MHRTRGDELRHPRPILPLSRVFLHGCAGRRCGRKSRKGTKINDNFSIRSYRRSLPSHRSRRFFSSTLVGSFFPTSRFGGDTGRARNASCHRRCIQSSHDFVAQLFCILDPCKETRLKRRSAMLHQDTRYCCRKGVLMFPVPLEPLLQRLLRSQHSKNEHVVREALPTQKGGRPLEFSILFFFLRDHPAMAASTPPATFQNCAWDTCIGSAPAASSDQKCASCR